jgi:hypothetical protein
MVQLHGLAGGLPVVRPTNDVDVLVHVETERGRPAALARALEDLGYRLAPSIDPRVETAHRFVRGSAVVDIVTSDDDRSVVDMVAADHAPPKTLERFRGHDLVRIEGGTQALRRTVLAELDITGGALTTLSVPDAFGALILKAAAHKVDARDRDRHLADAAVLLALWIRSRTASARGATDRAFSTCARISPIRRRRPGCNCLKVRAATARRRSTCSATDAQRLLPPVRLGLSPRGRGRRRRSSRCRGRGACRRSPGRRSARTA